MSTREVIALLERLEDVLERRSDSRRGRPRQARRVRLRLRAESRPRRQRRCRGSGRRRRRRARAERASQRRSGSPRRRLRLGLPSARRLRGVVAPSSSAFIAPIGRPPRVGRRTAQHSRYALRGAPRAIRLTRRSDRPSETSEARGPGGVPELRELALVERARFAALVAFDCGVRPLDPVHAGKCTSG